MAAKPSVTQIRLTPELARKLLGFGGPNRALSRHITDRYADAMAAGEWELNNDALVTDPDGLLINGQHRCAAVIKSGVTIDCLLVEGIRDRAHEVIDTGRVRRLGDVLAIRGEKNCNVLAAALNWLNRFRTNTARAGGLGSISHRQALKLLDDNPGIRDAVNDSAAIRRRLHTNSGLWSALVYMFAEIDSDDADVFVSRLVEGANLSETDPIRLLREVLIAEQAAIRKMPLWRLAALSIKAWNLYREGSTVRQLRFRAGGASPETFPQIQ